MSNVSLAIQNNSFLSLFSNTGLSNEAETLRERYEDAVLHLLQSQSLGERLHKNFKSLEEVVTEASTLNWDGYGALPVNKLAQYKAEQFLRALPLSIPNPEIGVDPDGEISFEWYNGRSKVFSISVSDTGKLTYAGIFGIRKVNGVEYFEDRIPRAIINNLQRLWREELNY